MDTHDPPPPTMQLWKVILVLTLGTFAMGNAKFSMIPLVSTIAQDLNSSNQVVLDSAFAYFWGGFIGAPILAIFFRHWHKTKILAYLSVWCFLGNLLTSFATSAEMLYWLRWLSGIPHAAFMAFATLLIAESAPKSQRGWYLGVILLGISLSTLLIVPFNTVIGIEHGWQMSFRFVSLLDLLIFLLVLDLLPKHNHLVSEVPLKQMFTAFQNSQIWLCFALGLCVITVSTAAWSFGIANIQDHSLTLPLKMVLMTILGVGFIIGQLLGGWAADGNVHRAIGINTVYTLAALCFLFACFFEGKLAMLGIFFISIAFATINVMMQIRLLDVPAAALYLIMCSFNACIQLGNFLGSSLSTWAQQHSSQASDLSSIISSTFPLSILAIVLWLCLHQIQKRQALQNA